MGGAGLPPRLHFWFGFPIPFVALMGAFSIISANAWMNAPAGFALGADGRPDEVNPLEAIFNDALPHQFVHFILAAYMAAGFTVASIYIVGWWKGRRDRYHRLGILIPLTLASIATPVQVVTGDFATRHILDHQPAKFAAAEASTESGTDDPVVLFGQYDADTNTIKNGIRIPSLGSIIVGGSRDTYVPGLDTIPPEDRPPNVTLVHWAFNIMVLIGTLLLGLAGWFGFSYWRRRDLPSHRLFLSLAAAAGVLAHTAVICGWIVTEVGRQAVGGPGVPAYR